VDIDNLWASCVKLNGLYGAVGWIDKDAPISDLGRQRQFVLPRAEKTL
jgi:hypothetical protein